MKLTFALLAPLVAIASAVAIDGSVSLDKRTTARVQLCINTQYNSCNVFVVQVGACTPVVPDFNDNVSSASADAGTNCFLWQNGDCTGASLGPLPASGIPDLRLFGFNDITSAVKCT